MTGLEVADLSVAYDGAPALRDVSLALPRGEVLAVLGPSGCGKSTLLRAVAGLEQPAAGRIAWEGRDLAGVPTHRRGFALMFQDGQLFEHLTVARNVAYPLRLRRPRPARAEVAARVAELLELVGLAGYADRAPGTLSGGERQRVALARALAVRPRLLLLDEPLSALDRELRERLAVDLAAILRAAGTTALMVTHDHEEAFAIAGLLAVLRAGRLVQSGPIADVWAAPADPATALFLGYARVLEGDAARAVDPAAAGPVALRRSALVVEPATAGAGTRPAAATGVPRLAGTVLEARATPTQVRLRVDVPALGGAVDAVAPLRSGGGPGAGSASAPGPWAPGTPVDLRVDTSRTARVGRTA